MSSRWIRLSTDWHLSNWLVVLSAESRLAWVQLLCHVKTNGFAGRCKALSPLVAERLWFVNEPSVRQMLQAAEQAGALVVEGEDWQVVKWREYQGDDGAADRQRRRREFKSRADVTDVTRDHRDVTDVTSTETETVTMTETMTETSPQTPRKAGGRVWEQVLPSAYWEAAMRWAKYRAEAKLGAWKPPTWAAQGSKFPSPDDFSAAVERSVSNGWHGLFQSESAVHRGKLAAMDVRAAALESLGGGE